jgi:hypothetical protein
MLLDDSRCLTGSAPLDSSADRFTAERVAADRLAAVMPDARLYRLSIEYRLYSDPRTEGTLPRG